MFFPDMDPSMVTDEELLSMKDADLEDFGDDEAEFEKEVFSFDTWAFVRNVPVIPQEKEAKLKSVLAKVFTSKNFGAPVEVILPFEGAKSKGTAFIQFKDKTAMMEAVKVANDYKLDANHVLKVVPFSDFEKYGNVPNEYQEPSEKEQPMLDSSMSDWLLDEDARDQFLIRAGDNTEIYFHHPLPAKFEKVYERSKWTENMCFWSPKGTYLATFHAQGIAVWGTSAWKQVSKFPHPNVTHIDFSPCEKYVVTFSPSAPADKALAIWDVSSGQALRMFKQVKKPEGETAVWPEFRWSHDDKYFARLENSALHIYETPSMKLLDKKSIKIPMVADFQWSPSENIIAYWQNEDKQANNPARITLISIPTKKEIRMKNLFMVGGCNLHWHPQGDYLAVKVDRLSKAKKVSHTSFEVFSLREKLVPVESLDVHSNIYAFAWEPKGHKFAIVHGDGSGGNTVDFYSMKPKGEAMLKLVHSAEKRYVNHIFWSPQGQYLLLAGLKNLNGKLEFWDSGNFEAIKVTEHFMATDVMWDPSGRFVATGISYFRHHNDNGYNIWLFNGKLLHNVLKDKFLSLAWRPRPPTLLTAEDEKEIKKNFSQYQKKYEQEDVLRKKAFEEAKREERRRLREEYDNLVAERREEVLADRKEFGRELPKLAASSFETVRNLVETVIEETKEVIKRVW
eukprot:CAMPEP_0113917488 /NCGR_PEP_ID=MMETSP0780_2-20120614/32772_1 /TAXON_ID=652834 /ORGANISM="Palpitomonas bilix" /LENGTH=677 /DNA_ID=CAMNT_0000917087 /DNA_START=1 /DNA_END=2031 /DNA_ORIENTATION=- /assembly_acc=CAM_ASM_000599